MLMNETEPGRRLRLTTGAELKQCSRAPTSCHFTFTFTGTVEWCAEEIPATCDGEAEIVP